MLSILTHQDLLQLNSELGYQSLGMCHGIASAYAQSLHALGGRSAFKHRLNLIAQHKHEFGNQWVKVLRNKIKHAQQCVLSRQVLNQKQRDFLEIKPFFEIVNIYQNISLLKDLYKSSLTFFQFNEIYKFTNPVILDREKIVSLTQVIVCNQKELTEYLTKIKKTFNKLNFTISIIISSTIHSIAISYSKQYQQWRILDVNCLNLFSHYFDEVSASKNILHMLNHGFDDLQNIACAFYFITLAGNLHPANKRIFNTKNLRYKITSKDLARCGIDGGTILHIVVNTGNQDLLKKILQWKNIDINKANIHGITALHCASAGNNTNIVKMLIEKNADAEYKDNKNITPFALACYIGINEIVKILITLHPDVNVKNVYGYTPLHLACITGNVEIVKELLKNHANPMTTNVEEETAIYLAANNGHTEIVQILLSYYADNINHQNNDLLTALHTAIINNHLHVVQVLLTHPNLIIDVTDPNLNTPLHFACQLGHSNMVLSLLNCKNIDITKINLTGRTALDEAIYQNHTPIIKLFLDYIHENQLLAANIISAPAMEILWKGYTTLCNYNPEQITLNNRFLAAQLQNMAKKNQSKVNYFFFKDNPMHHCSTINFFLHPTSRIRTRSGIVRKIHGCRA